MDLRRRHYLASVLPLSAALLWPSASPAGQKANDAERASYIAARKRGEDDFEAVLLDDLAQPLKRIALPGRAHGAAAFSKKGLVVMFARRPGRYMCCINTQSNAEPIFISPPEGRHFYGHGAYSVSGNLLFTTENDYDGERGIIGLYDVTQGYRRVGEWLSHGLGPHDIKVIPELQLVVVANGGIKTHPSTGRDKLNISNMQPSICLLDMRTGQLVAKHVLPERQHQLSLRHIEFTCSGNIWFAGQYEGTTDTIESLAGWFNVSAAVASFKNGMSRSDVFLLPMSADLVKAAKGYFSSIAVNKNSVVLSAARGNLAIRVDEARGQILEQISMLDCSGVATGSVDTNHCETNENPEDEPYLISSGTGEMRFIPENPERPPVWQGAQWDNHLYRV